MISLLSKGNLVAILRNEEKWEILICLNESLKIERFVYEKSINRLLKELSNYYHRSIIDDKKILSEEYGIKQKVPMLIHPNHLLLFQTTSLNHPKCTIFNYFCIHKYKKIEKNTLLELCIPYKNNKIIIDEKILISCDIRTIHNQMKRCFEIDKVVKERYIF